VVDYHLKVHRDAETGIVSPRPKLPGFHMSGSATCPIYQTKRHGEGQRKEVYYKPRTQCGKRQSKHSAHLQPSSEYRGEL
jgi:hypothetical protein